MNSYKNVIRMSNFTELGISENKEPGHTLKKVILPLTYIHITIS